MTINWLAQAIGVLGVIAFILSFQIKSNAALLITQMFADSMFCIQFILLGAYSGCLSILIMVLRNLPLLYRGKRRWADWKGWPAAIIALLVICTAITWEGVKSLLPLLASVIGTLAYWTGSARAFRTSNLFCACPCWLTYDLLVGSYAGALNEVITIVSIVTSILRFGWKALGDSSFGKSEKPAKKV